MPVLPPKVATKRPRIARAAAPVAWAIWRPDAETQYRSLEADEAAMLDALVAMTPATAREAQGVMPVSLMNPIVVAGAVYRKNRDYYLDELFAHGS